MTDGDGVAGSPWRLTTSSGGSQFEAWRDPGLDPPALVVQVKAEQWLWNFKYAGPDGEIESAVNGLRSVPEYEARRLGNR